MVNKKAWQDNFSKLDAESQLEVARAIVEELKNNEEFHITDSYDEKKSREVRDFLVALIASTGSKTVLDDLKTGIQQFDSFSKDVKDFVVSGIIDALKEGEQFHEQEQAREVCNLKGHVFGEWIEVDKYTGAVLNKSHQDGIMTRMCHRCSFVEYKPKMLIKGSSKNEG